jgi:hypothetical protein
MGVFTTSDNGGRWRETNNGFARRPVDRMFALNGQIYATNIGAGAFASKDNGLSWNAAAFPEEVARTVVGRVAGFNESNGKLWAFSGGPDGASGVGYAYSLNDGATWTPMPEANGQHPRANRSLWLHLPRHAHRHHTLLGRRRDLRAIHTRLKHHGTPAAWRQHACH